MICRDNEDSIVLYLCAEDRSSNTVVNLMSLRIGFLQALKIQFLRLIHNFCDRDSCNRANKQLLLQPSSSKVLQKLSYKGLLSKLLVIIYFFLTLYLLTVMQDGSYSWNRVGEYKEPEGLMVKILKVLINEPADSLYRYAFLQIFLLHGHKLKCVFKCFVTDELVYFSRINIAFVPLT